MPHILDLANEILDQIIAATSPQDIENLAASCRRINIIAQSKLKRHHELKRKYARLAFRYCGDPYDISAVHPIYLLRDVLHDATIAQYPTVIRSEHFGANDYDELNDDYAMAEFERVEEVAFNCATEIKDAINQCPFIQIPERKVWKVQIMQGDGDAVFGLLLTLLPHLTSMVIEQRPEGLMMKMFKKIVELQQPPHKNAPQALTKLNTVSTGLFYSTFDRRPANDFGYLSHYALLPSMRSITGWDFSAAVGSYTKSFQWSLNPGISAVTEINIHRSKVDGESITNLLRGVRALERFSFVSSAYNNPTLVYQPRKMMNGLMQYAKCSLSYLRLTRYWAGTNGMHDDDLEYNLRCFEKLKELRIDHVLLSHFNRPCLALCKGEWQNHCFCWPQRLVDVLPASLESLRLVGPVSWKRIEAFFGGFSELKAERLPRLREIGVQGSGAADMRFVHLCKEVGVVLTQNGAENYGDH